MRIRDAFEPDLTPITALENWAIRETPAHFAEQEMPVAEMVALWAQTRGRFPWLVAEDDAGAFLGYARASAWKSRCAYRYSAEITVYVEPAHHRRGVGRALYTELFARLDASGYRTLIAGITLPNDPSVQLHEAMGMTKVAHFPRVGWKFGAWRDVGYWALELGDPDSPPRDVG